MDKNKFIDLNNNEITIIPKNGLNKKLHKDDIKIAMNGSMGMMNKVDSIASSMTVDGLADLPGEDEPMVVERAAWGSKLQYLLTIVGYAVGLGNIWRFPYLCQQNGGGAFLIPYIIMLFLEGVPLFYLELGIGQRIRKGSIGVWNEISPMLGGLGIASTLVSFIIGLYYNVIIAWCIYYIFMSFRKVLPWSSCPTVTTWVPKNLSILDPDYITDTNITPVPSGFSLRKPSFLRSDTQAMKSTTLHSLLLLTTGNTYNNSSKNLSIGNHFTNNNYDNNNVLSPLQITNTSKLITSLDDTLHNLDIHKLAGLKSGKQDLIDFHTEGKTELINNLAHTKQHKRSPINDKTNMVPVKRHVLECQLSSSTQYFWYRKTLNISPGIDIAQGINWKILICLTIAWTVVFLCIMKGIKSSGMAAYFTATFPYAVLIIIFARSMLLDGATDGIAHMFTPVASKLADPKVWLEAATQIFYSMGLGFGSIIAFSSYNPPRNDCRKDVIIVSAINVFTSIFASIVVFSVLGFKAKTNLNTCHQNNQENIYQYYNGAFNSSYIKTNYDSLLSNLSTANSTGDIKLYRCNLKENLNQVAEGTGLAFIVFTQAILEFPGAPFWSIIFFSMLITLGLGTMFGLMESIITSIHDLHLFPWLRKEYVSAILCSISLGIGFIFVLCSGDYWVQLFDTFAGNLTLVIVAFFEIIAVSYVYGHTKFSRDLEIMTGHYPGWYWQITWRYVSPIIMALIFLASIVKWIISPPHYSKYVAATASTISTPYPIWVLLVIGLVITIGVFPIPFIAFLRYFGIVKFEPDIATGAKRMRTTESTAKILSSTTTLNNLDELGTVKPSLETIKEIA